MKFIFYSWVRPKFILCKLHLPRKWKEKALHTMGKRVNQHKMANSRAGSEVLRFSPWGS